MIGPITTNLASLAEQPNRARRAMVHYECAPYASLLADALRRIAGAAESIGIAAVLVQAKDEAAKAFYLAQAEWLEFLEGGRVLWLPVGVVLE
jgi:hypothetical protein